MVEKLTVLWPNRMSPYGPLYRNSIIIDIIDNTIFLSL